MIGAVNSSYLASMPVASTATKVTATSEIKPNSADSARLAHQSAQGISYSPNLRSEQNQFRSSSNGQDAQDPNSQARFERELLRQQAQVQQVIQQLKARDREVRAHEMAHLTAAGGYAIGGMSFIYQAGPDGRQYAIGGEVGIDTSPVAGDPEATIDKAMVIQRAALAPAEPSAQDRRVASDAVQMMAQARIELAAQRAEEREQSQTVDEVGGQQGEVTDSTSAEVSKIEPRFIEGSGEVSSRLATEATFARQQFDLRVQLPYIGNFG